MSAMVEPVLHKLSIEAFNALWRAGHLGEGDRVELIDGLILDMAPIGRPHMSLVNRLTRWLVHAVGERGVVSVQNSIVLPPWSQPQPDLAVLAPAFFALQGNLPQARDVLLLIEVADSSLAFDRGRKLSLYSREGIAEYWVVDVAGCAIEVFRELSPEGYRSRRRMVQGERAVMLALHGVELTVDELFA